jgi:demethylmenaquinone methyltransferase/2-methoxy-6-polyprenyl-1,4-benzoquinol methylase
VSVWQEVNVALDKIIEDYEKINHIISLYQDDKVRLKGLEMIYPSAGIALELGSGPGNYSNMILKVHRGHLVCLDFSQQMLKRAREKKLGHKTHLIRGVFDALPFREGIFNLVTAAYALRDSIDISRSIAESYTTLKFGGRFLLIDIGKPDNLLIQGFMRLFMKYLVPIMGGLFAGYGYNNPWSVLYKTFERLPPNGTLEEHLKKMLDNLNKEFFVFGALIIFEGTKK